MIFDTEALRQWADMHVPEEEAAARQLWKQLRDDCVAAADVIDDQNLEIERLTRRARSLADEVAS